jgi:hypothetical protein
MARLVHWGGRRLLLGLVAGLLGLGGLGITHASINTCRTDPVITLSDGSVITLYEDISDTATDVTGITYQLHVPVGDTVTSISYPGAVSSRSQSVTVTADENPGNYDGYATVDTGTSSISVAAYASGTADGTNTVSAHTNGHSGQVLHSHLHL